MRRALFCVLIFFITTFTAQSQISNSEARKLTEEGIAEHDKGNYEKAISLYEEALKLEPGNELIIYEMGYTFFEMKNYSKVISLINDYQSKNDSKNPEMYVLLGSAYDVINDPGNSIDTYNKGLEKFPNSGILYYNYGITLTSEKKFIEALEKFEKGIAVDPSYSSNFYMAAKLLSTSQESVWSLIYGEIYLNRQPTGDRAVELSKIIYSFYDKSITKTDKGYNVSLNLQNILGMEKDKKSLQLRYTMIMAIAVVALIDHGTNIHGFVRMKKAISEVWNEKNEPEFKNIIFDRAKEISNENEDYLTCYYYLMFAYADPDNFNEWYKDNEVLFEEFAEWMSRHPLKITSASKYYRQQY
jgi:tetratricopeptide (TPR) repeat protein